MGNRAIITLEDIKGKKHPVALYVHWNGGLESVLAFVEYTWAMFPRGRSDVYTFHARLCQVLGNFFPDGLSLYGHALRVAKNYIEDNGCFHFRVAHDGVTLIGRADEIPAARAHEYWTNPHTIHDSIKQAMPTKNAEHMAVGGVWNVPTETKGLNALQVLGVCWTQHNLCSTASEAERIAFIDRITTCWNLVAAPLLREPAQGEAVA
jgi:hypothetical protein